MPDGNDELTKSIETAAASAAAEGAKDKATAADAAAALLQRRAGPAAGGREISLNTLVHLMGLPTASQVDLLETKLDLVSNRLGQVMTKLERIAADIDMIKSDATVDRIDFQLSDIRALLKRTVPAGAGGEPDAKSDAPKGASSRAKILKSEPPKADEPKAETKIVGSGANGGGGDALSEFDEPLDDASFQAQQAKRMREKEGA